MAATAWARRSMLAVAIVVLFVVSPIPSDGHRGTFPASPVLVRAAAPAAPPPAAATPATSGASAATAHWFNITRAGPHLEGRNRGVFVYDAFDGYDLLFGGYDANGFGWLSDTWTDTSGTWAPLSPASSPGARSSASAAYDPSLGGVVVFGGYLYGVASPYYNDTWLFQSGAWSHLATPVAPPARSEAAMAYDAALGELVLFGGTNGTTLFSDTWAYGAGGWTQLSPSQSPPALSGASMAYESSGGRLVLYGGTVGPSDATGTWTFDGNWVSLSSAASPGGLYLPAMATLPNGTVVLAGGLARTGTSAPVTPWAFENDAWASMGAGSGPNSRVGAMMTYDSTVGYPVLFGGRNFSGPGESLNDSWALDSLSAQELAFATNGVAPFTITPTATVVGGPLNFDGSSSVAYSWTFGDGTNSTAAAPSHTYNVAGNDTLRLILVDGFGLGVSFSTSISVEFLVNIAIVPVSFPELTYGFSATSANSTGSITLSWAFGDGATSTSATPTHTYSLSGVLTVHVQAKDSTNAVGGGARSFTVPPGLAVQLHAPSHATTGTPAVFSATATGGAGGYVFTWNFSDGTTATGPSVSRTFGSGSVGTVSGRLVVADANGTDQNLSFSVAVAAAPGGGSGAAGGVSGDPTTVLALVLGIAVAAGAGAGLLVGLARRPRSPPRSPRARNRPPG